MLRVPMRYLSNFCQRYQFFFTHPVSASAETYRESSRVFQSTQIGATHSQGSLFTLSTRDPKHGMVLEVNNPARFKADKLRAECWYSTQARNATDVIQSSGFYRPRRPDAICQQVVSSLLTLSGCIKSVNIRLAAT